MRTTRPVSAQSDWENLDLYQGSLTRAVFEHQLLEVYDPAGALNPYILVSDTEVAVFSSAGQNTNALWRLRFAATGLPLTVAPSTFRNFAELRRLRNPVDRPLRGLCLALDPGHIGGEWARMEDRHFQAGRGDRPVQEADLNLRVARLLRARLEAAGAEVRLVKNRFEPVTEQRPPDFRETAEQFILRENSFSVLPTGEREVRLSEAIRRCQEHLFYRGAEIAARARVLNEKLRPDLTLCIHFNAVEGPRPDHLVEDNALVVFVQGNYQAEELADGWQRFRLLRKLLEQSAPLELEVAVAVADSLARETQLPPVQEQAGGPARRAGPSPYVYRRNLAANRLYNGPVLYLEPYYQNNRIVYERIQRGDYDGFQLVGGRRLPSIFREYADAVARGLIAFYQAYTVDR